MKFIKKYVTDEYTPVVLRAKEKKWPVKLYYDAENQSAKFISVALSKFVKDNKLEEGDKCVFELVDEEDFVLQVTGLKRVI